MKGDDADTPGGASSPPDEQFAPEDDCQGCGVRASLVPPDFRRCGDCQAALDVILAEEAAKAGRT